MEEGMDREHLKRLRLDVRLTSRRGWIDSEELERERAALPDAAHKIAAAEPQESEGGGGTEPVA